MKIQYSIKPLSDFQNISSQINDINLIPTLGDLDGMDLDAIVGDYSGKLHFLENVSLQIQQ